MYLDVARARALVLEAKCNYFRNVLAPYITDGVLDTRRLKAENSRLYEEFRLAYKGIQRGCTELGLYRSKAAKDRAEGIIPRRGAYQRVAACRQTERDTSNRQGL